MDGALNPTAGSALALGHDAGVHTLVTGEEHIEMLPRDLAETPLQRTVRSEEIGHAVLCAPASAFTTGARLVDEGGLSISML